MGPRGAPDSLAEASRERSGASRCGIVAAEGGGPASAADAQFFHDVRVQALARLKCAQCQEAVQLRLQAQKHLAAEILPGRGGRQSAAIDLMKGNPFTDDLAELLVNF